MRLLKCAPVALVAILFVPFLAYSNTIIVPDHQPTIQGAIDAAVNGDTVLVKPGTYVENINFKGKAITVISSGGPAGTVIDGGQPVNPEFASVATFNSGETWDSVLDGFTLMNGDGNKFGYTSERGGGIACISSSPLIRNNIIEGNSVSCVHGGWASGGGIYSNAAARIENNIIRNNGSGGYASGGGIACVGTTLVKGNRIYENSSDFGGGVSCSGSAVILGNMIHDNYASSGSGVEAGSGSLIRNNILYGNYTSTTILPTFRGTITASSCTVANNIIYANLTRGIASMSSPLMVNNTIFGNTECGTWCWNSGTPEIHNSILWDNGMVEIELDGPAVVLSVSHSDVKSGWPGAGNIDSDPLLVDPANGDFHLTYPSPCRDTGDNSVVTELNDFEGDPRIAWDGTVDMGADEFYTHLYCMGDFTPGGSIEGRFVGLPGTTPVGLFVGSGALPSPLSTMWGEYWLQAPYVLLGPLGAIPSDGVMVLLATLPPGMTVPEDIPMQALLGLNPDSLTNLCVLEVR